ncbi:hypothetical protein JZ751_000140 [Albula glossodonta]|uniref:Uncharacterized protein n=1 Tax=Albula glossodonta TaxID=121402 RepID=A0A8T2PUY1_9TELE|nr:hypothetical protein JZ751_000140 [Albula glossodonta]
MHTPPTLPSLCGGGPDLRVAKPCSQQGMGKPGLLSRGSWLLWNHSRVWARREGDSGSRAPGAPTRFIANLHEGK